MTEILNEMICGTINSVQGSMSITGELKVSKEGVISKIDGGSIYIMIDGTEETKQYIGSFNVQSSSDINNPNGRSISMNIQNLEHLSEASEAINTMLKEIEDLYKA